MLQSRVLDHLFLVGQPKRNNFIVFIFDMKGVHAGAKKQESMVFRHDMIDLASAANVQSWSAQHSPSKSNVQYMTNMTYTGTYVTLR